jgi:MOSC domain-containing protein YiiM
LTSEEAVHSEAKGRVEAIWIKRANGGPMDPVTDATLIASRGIQGNANQGGWRQVTVIEREVFDDLKDSFSDDVDPAMRRANLMISGVRLPNTRFHRLHVGDAVILLRGETRPCQLMDDTLPGLRKALQPDWSGGAFGSVLSGGAIRVGDEVWLEEPVAEAEHAPKEEEEKVTAA